VEQKKPEQLMAGTRETIRGKSNPNTNPGKKVKKPNIETKESAGRRKSAPDRLQKKERNKKKTK